MELVIIGLGYVGLPLALEFAKRHSVIGFDTSDQRVTELNRGLDRNREYSTNELLRSRIKYTSDPSIIDGKDIYILCVPTPIDSAKVPDTRLLETAAELVGARMRRGSLVVIESTVYPGLTSQVLAPILESVSGLTFNVDFYMGYSPERIDPGNKVQKLTNTTKIVAGSNEEVTKQLESLYGSIIKAGIHVASSIEVAEAAKVIENIQRDLNIALANEFSMIFDRMGIDTGEVLNAAATKWNFMPYRPGLVGGHCIGVDPYYLTYRAQQCGHIPELILAGRKINDSMGEYVANKFLSCLTKKGHVTQKNRRVLILGYTFKENCRDTRNTRVSDIIRVLAWLNLDIDVYDPLVDVDEPVGDASKYFVSEPEIGAYVGIIIAVAHDTFKEWGIDKVRKFGVKNALIYDVKSIFPSNSTDIRL